MRISGGGATYPTGVMDNGGVMHPATVDPYQQQLQRVTTALMQAVVVPLGLDDRPGVPLPAHAAAMGEPDIRNWARILVDQLAAGWPLDAQPRIDAAVDTAVTSLAQRLAMEPRRYTGHAIQPLLTMLMRLAMVRQTARETCTGHLQPWR